MPLLHLVAGAAIGSADSVVWEIVRGLAPAAIALALLVGGAVVMLQVMVASER